MSRTAFPAASFGRGLVAPLARALRGLRPERALGARLAERRGIAGRARPDGPLVWLHAETIEDFRSIAPLIEAVTARGFWALATTGPAEPEAVATRPLPEGAIHQYAPVDREGPADRFLAHWRPDLTLVAGGLASPTLLSRAQARGAPVVLVDARAPDSASLRRRRFRRSFGALLGRFDLCLARSEADAAALAELGASRVSSAGDLRVEAAPPTADPARLAALSRATRGRPVAFAACVEASEHGGVARAHAIARAHAPDLITILAPSLAEEGAAAVEAAEFHGVVAARWAAGEEIARDTELYVADAAEEGEIGALCRVSDVVFMGGSLAPCGGRNPVGPVKLGAPLLHGPHVEDFFEIYRTLDEHRAALGVDSPDALGAEAARLIGDPPARAAMALAGREACAALGGARAKTLAAIEPYLMQLRLGAA